MKFSDLIILDMLLRKNTKVIGLRAVSPILMVYDILKSVLQVRSILEFITWAGDFPYFSSPDNHHLEL